MRINRSSIAPTKSLHGLVCLVLAGMLIWGVLRAAPAPGVVVPLDKKEQKKVEEAIERGVTYLRRMQLVAGFFGDGNPFGKKLTSRYPVGYAALPALALLESGIPPGDPAIEKAGRFVRQNAGALTRTYEISLALLFLDRLGKIEDRPLIRSLAFRLAAGQTHLGGWGYQCPILSPAQEKKVEGLLGKHKPENNPKPFPIPDPKGPDERADNSNTQFAILALWAARRHKLPLEWSFAQIERRFRSSQEPRGWGYRLRKGFPSGSMTCVGLLGLAVGRGSAEETRAGKEEEFTWGLRALAWQMNDASDVRGMAGNSGFGPKGKLNLYYLWSVERVGVLLNLETIGGRDWYRWGADLLLRTQNLDGSWTGRGNGGSAAVIDTSMALLFLKRSDLLPDLRETLQKRLKITDPYFDKAISPKKSPGEKSDLKKGIEKKSPGEKNDLKDGIDKKGSREKTGLSMPEPFPFTQPRFLFWEAMPDLKPKFNRQSI